MDNNVRLIDANALPVHKAYCVDEAGWGANFCVVDKDDIDNAPTIEPDSLRPTGRWGWCKDHWECTNCRMGRYHDLVLGLDAAYCGRCGAKMEG